MTIRVRLAAAAGLCVLWFGVFAPAISDHIHATTLEGPKPFSVQNVRDHFANLGDTGSSPVDDDVEALLAELSGLELAEEERVMAMYGLLDTETLAQTSRLMGAMPPLEYAVDPRFFEPVAPSIVRQSIEVYGYAVAKLPTASRMTRPNDMDRQDVLMQVLCAIQQRLLSPEQAAMVLQGAIQLLDYQTKRMEIEAELRQSIDHVVSE